MKRAITKAAITIGAVISSGALVHSSDGSHEAAMMAILICAAIFGGLSAAADSL